MTKRILYALCSAVLLALPWLGAPALTLLVAFVPLLILQQELADANAGQTVQVSGTGQEKPLKFPPRLPAAGQTVG